MDITIDTGAVADKLVENAKINGKLDELVSSAMTKAMGALEKRITDPKGGYMIATEDGNGEAVKSLPDWLIHVGRAARGNTHSITRLREHYKSTKALSGGTDSAGGYTLPDDFRADLLRPAGEMASLVGPRATQIRTNSRSVEFPTLDMDTAPANGSAQYGGVVMTLTGEGVAKTETEPAFGTTTVTVYKLAALTIVSDELLADSGIGLADLITMLFRGAMEDRWEAYRINGTGSGQPLGIIHSNATGTITVSRATGGNDFDLADALAMMSRLLIKNPGAVAWGIHPFHMANLAQMALSGNSMVSYIPNLNDAPPMRLLGYPVVPSEHLADPGDAGDVVLGDFSGYLRVIRQDITIDTSIHYKFNTDQTTFRVVQREGGRPWLMAPVPMRGHAAGTGDDAGFTRSHFVKLGA